jgi:chromosome segregation ATPase
MTRAVDALDKDLGKLEKDFPPVQTAVADIQKALGTLPKSPDVASRLSALEKLPGEVAALTARTEKLSEKVKELRYMALGLAAAATGLAASATLIKVDIQLIKVDLTLLKKIDEKNPKYQWLAEKVTKPVRLLRDSIFRERAEQRRHQELAEQRAKDAAKELRLKIEGLPPRVAANEEAIEKIQHALRAARDTASAARDDRTGLSSRHKGVDAQKPAIGPVAKDVKNLRNAVDELISSLAGI